MNMIIKNEEVFDKHGDLVKLVYYYVDGSKGERKVFISSEELEKMESVKKRWLGSNS
jgi:hypothetical protein